MVKSQQRSNLFHFKVMELTSHEDRDPRDGIVGSECTLKFHFFFDLLRIQLDEKLEKFTWDVNSKPQ